MGSNEKEMFLQLEKLGELLDSIKLQADDKQHKNALGATIMTAIVSAFDNDAVEIMNFITNLFGTALKCSVKEGKQAMVLQGLCNEMFEELECNYKCVEIN